LSMDRQKLAKALRKMREQMNRKMREAMKKKC